MPFTTEEKVAFKELVNGFENSLKASNFVKKYEIDSLTLARTGGVGIARPQPYIARTYAGTDMTSNFEEYTQLSVPATVNIFRSNPVTFPPYALTDPQRLQDIIKAGRDKIASDIETDLLDVMINQGTRVIKRTSSASGPDDVGQASVLLSEIGIPEEDRVFFYSGADYLSVTAGASGLSNRQLFDGDVKRAYTDGKATPRIYDFETLRMPRIRALPAANATATVNLANQFYVPTSVSNNRNTDNRYQTISIAVSANTVKVGDCISFPGVFDVHMIGKQVLPTLKTFRITAIVTGTGGVGTNTVQISPPIISAQGGTTAERQYQNCSATPANGASIIFLNTVTRAPSIFFHKDAVEILPADVDSMEGSTGLESMVSKTDSGFPIMLSKYKNGDTLNTRMRIDIRYGISYTGPEHGGIMLFNQT